jgi:hypothetical protein
VKSDGAIVLTAGDDPEIRIISVRLRGHAHWEKLMNRRTTSLLAAVLIAAPPALAAEVTPERLINAEWQHLR